MDKLRPHVHVLPWMVAGVQTQFVHLARELERADIDHTVSEIHPWVDGGRIERLPLPPKTRGTARSVISMHRAFRTPADAVWTQVALPLLPYLLTTRWLRRAPVFYAIDCTPKLLFEQGHHYRGLSTDPRSLKGLLTTAALKAFFRRCTCLLPWSAWAARSMIDDYGADPARVRVIHPGIDTSRWRPSTQRAVAPDRLRLLFVGGDFERKGGPLLLDVYRHHLRDRCELHLVTKTNHRAEPGITFYRDYGPDDDGLLELFQRSDVLVVPTLADCFSIAAIEAMACGLPVITCPVGGIPEIVVDGETGFLVPPGDAKGLLQSIQALANDAGLQRRFGQAGRAATARQFDASTQSRLLTELIVNAIEFRGQSLSPASATQKSCF